MKTVLLMMAAAGLMMPLAACKSQSDAKAERVWGWETLTDTKMENAVRLKHAAAMDVRQINNDWQYMLYLDRPVWLSRYPIPND